jgi:hypothetical protein
VQGKSLLNLRRGKVIKCRVTPGAILAAGQGWPAGTSWREALRGALCPECEDTRAAAFCFGKAREAYER